MSRRTDIINGALEQIDQERPNLDPDDYARRIDLLEEARREPAAPWEELVNQATEGT